MIVASNLHIRPRLGLTRDPDINLVHLGHLALEPSLFKLVQHPPSYPEQPPPSGITSPHTRNEHRYRHDRHQQREYPCLIMNVRLYPETPHSRQLTIGPVQPVEVPELLGREQPIGFSRYV